MTRPNNPSPPDPDAPVREFRPERWELLILAEHYLKFALDREFFGFCYGHAGGGGQRAYAYKRARHLSNLLGENAGALRDRVWEEFGRQQDPRAWAIFLHGNQQERTDFQEESWL